MKGDREKALAAGASEYVDQARRSRAAARHLAPLGAGKRARRAPALRMTMPSTDRREPPRPARRRHAGEPHRARSRPRAARASSSSRRGRARRPSTRAARGRSRSCSSTCRCRGWTASRSPGASVRRPSGRGGAHHLPHGHPPRRALRAQGLRDGRRGLHHQAVRRPTSCARASRRSSTSSASASALACSRWASARVSATRRSRSSRSCSRASGPRAARPRSRDRRRTSSSRPCRTSSERRSTRSSAGPSSRASGVTTGPGAGRSPTIERNARAQMRIIEDMLDMGRISAASCAWTSPTRKSPTRSNGASARRAPAGRRKERRASWSDVTPGVGVIAADAERCSRSSGTCLTNAIKFTPSGDGRV